MQFQKKCIQYDFRANVKLMLPDLNNVTHGKGHWNDVPTEIKVAGNIAIFELWKGPSCQCNKVIFYVNFISFIAIFYGHAYKPTFMLQ